MSFDKIINSLRRQQEADREMIELEPAIDEKDIPDGVQSREEAELERGGVLMGTIEPGEGDDSPQNGDLVFVHYTLMDSKEKIIESTRAECGGPGHPRPFILGKAGKAARPLRGFEIALTSMRLRQRCALQLKPEFAFLNKECVLKPPVGLRKEDPVTVDVQLVAFHHGVHVRSVGDQGIVFMSLTDGNGWETPRAPFDVTFKLSARHLASNGSFESGQQYFPLPTSESLPAETELNCTLGNAELPSGLEAAIEQVHRGEKALVWCPARLATGGTAIPAPPNPPTEGSATGSATGASFPSLHYVEFTITLLDFLQVRDLTGDGGAMKRTLRKGRGDFPADCPLEDTTVQAKIRIRAAGGEGGKESEWMPLPGSSDAEGSISIETGMGMVPQPVEAALRLMLRGEVASVVSTWSHAYGGPSKPSLKKVVSGKIPISEDSLDEVPSIVPPGLKVEFEVELVDFAPIPSLAEITGGEKLEQAVKWKEQGNALFKGAKYKLARNKYMKGIRSVDQAMDLETEEEFDAAKAVKVACLVNLAACAQKEEEYGEVIQWCTKAISEDETHAKAHFRRAVARYNLGQEDAAKEDFATVKRLDPGAAGDVDRELARMAARAKAAAEKQAKEWGSFFGGKKK